MHHTTPHPSPTSCRFSTIHRLSKDAHKEAVSKGERPTAPRHFAHTGSSHLETAATATTPGSAGQGPAGSSAMHTQDLAAGSAAGAAAGAGEEGSIASRVPLDETERVLALQIALKVADIGSLAETLQVGALFLFTWLPFEHFAST